MATLCTMDDQSYSRFIFHLPDLPRGFFKMSKQMNFILFIKKKMQSLYAPVGNGPVTSTVTFAQNSACTPAGMYQYQTDLSTYTTCHDCARQGWGTMKTADGRLVCDTSQQKAAAAASCPAGPVNPCTPFIRPPPDSQWDVPHSWGASVFDPSYGTYILWGTWDTSHNRPYFAANAPYMRAGLNVPCPP
jgi:hypothetical protein